MKWSDVRQAYPDRWLIVEALEAHNTGDQRELDRLAVVEECADGISAFHRYQAPIEFAPAGGVHPQIVVDCPQRVCWPTPPGAPRFTSFRGHVKLPGYESRWLKANFRKPGSLRSTL